MGMRDYVPVFLSEIFSLKSDNFNKCNNKSGCKGLNPIPAARGRTHPKEVWRGLEHRTFLL